MSSSQVDPDRLYAIIEETISRSGREVERRQRARISEFALRQAASYRLAIITALPREAAAIRAVFDDGIALPGTSRSAVEYREIQCPASGARSGAKHRILLCQSLRMGTNSAAVAATALLADYPTVEDILLVGIAGGVPNLRAAKERHRGVTDHVRKGDIVVSEQVVQYDLVKMEEDRTENRSKGVAPSARLLNALNQLEQGIERGQRPWETIIDEVSKRSNWRRPRTDLLFDFAEKPKKRIQHPKTLRTGFPQVHRGPIGSANILLKSHSLRDALRDKFNIRAVEMEASGVADAAWNFAVGYITIRGVCDYCDASKDDAWQRYAALVAAAFARSLIARLPVS